MFRINCVRLYNVWKSDLSHPCGSSVGLEVGRVGVAALFVFVFAAQNRGMDDDRETYIQAYVVTDGPRCEPYTSLSLSPSHTYPSHTL